MKKQVSYFDSIILLLVLVLGIFSVIILSQKDIQLGSIECAPGYHPEPIFPPGGVNYHFWCCDDNPSTNPAVTDCYLPNPDLPDPFPENDYSCGSEQRGEFREHRYLTLSPVLNCPITACDGSTTNKQYRNDVIQRINTYECVCEHMPFEGWGNCYWELIPEDACTVSTFQSCDSVTKDCFVCGDEDYPVNIPITIVTNEINTFKQITGVCSGNIPEDDPIIDTLIENNQEKTIKSASPFSLQDFQSGKAYIERPPATSQEATSQHRRYQIGLMECRNYEDPTQLVPQS